MGRWWQCRQCEEGPVRWWWDVGGRKGEVVVGCRWEEGEVVECRQGRGEG